MTSDERRNRYMAAITEFVSGSPEGDRDAADAAMAVADREIIRALVIADAAHDVKVRDLETENAYFKALLNTANRHLDARRIELSKVKERHAEELRRSEKEEPVSVQCTCEPSIPYYEGPSEPSEDCPAHGNPATPQPICATCGKPIHYPARTMDAGQCWEHIGHVDHAAVSLAPDEMCQCGHGRCQHSPALFRRCLECNKCSRYWARTTDERRTEES